jgi:hypothetical protein
MSVRMNIQYVLSSIFNTLFADLRKVLEPQSQREQFHKTQIVTFAEGSQMQQICVNPQICKFAICGTYSTCGSANFWRNDLLCVRVQMFCAYTKTVVCVHIHVHAPYTKCAKKTKLRRIRHVYVQYFIATISWFCVFVSALIY